MRDYDICVLHPPTLYKDGRPTWLALDETRQPVYIKPVAGGTFLVQAYYQGEIDNNEGKPWQLVPADQTYIYGPKKNFLLYLKKGKYKIFFRDINYHILDTLNIEVS